MSADKGLSFDFTNNQRLKESGFALDGVVVNGFVNENGVTININSAKALNSVVGHEITHVLEGTDMYAPLQELITQHAKNKGEYDSRLEAITKLYEGRDANIEQELVADLVGDYLFSEPDFIRTLSTEHRNVFQKLYDEIKYLCKVATAGSKELRELEKVKKVFAELYREAETKNPTADGGVKYSLGDINYSRNTIDFKDTTGRRAAEDKTVNSLVHRGKVTTITQKDIPAEIAGTNWADKDEARNTIRGILKQFLGEDAVFNLGDESAIAYLTSKGIDHTLAGDNTKEKAAALSKFYELVSNAEYSYSSLSDEHSKTEGREDWDYFVSVAEVEGGGTVPLVFAIRSIDQDVRSQIYNIATKKDPVIPRGDGTQKKSANAHPSYGDSPSLDENVPQETPNVNNKNSLSPDVPIAPVRGGIYGKDIALAPVREDIAQAKSEQNLLWQVLTAIANEGKTTVQSNTKQHISMEDYANQDSPVFKNVDYNDEATKAAIMQQTHDAMVAEGAVVTISDSVTNDVAQSFPDLRSMKKKDRNPILKTAMTKLKNDLRQFLNGFKNQNFEFEVNGKVLDATLYNTGINEVLEKVTKDKASMLYSTEGIFQNARYLYSTQDYDGDPNVYRWNYFYTPVQIGDQTVGVRIAVRDLAKQGESQIYNWGIKKNASLGGVRDDLDNRKPYDASSDASKDIIPQSEPDVNQDNMQKEEDPLYGPWRMKDLLDIGVEKLYRMMLREQISEED